MKTLILALVLAIFASEILLAETITPDGAGGYNSPKGRYNSNSVGGLWGPDGYYKPDGNGGFLGPDGRHLRPNGVGGFIGPDTFDYNDGYSDAMNGQKKRSDNGKYIEGYEDGKRIKESNNQWQLVGEIVEVIPEHINRKPKESVVRTRTSGVEKPIKQGRDYEDGYVDGYSKYPRAYNNTSGYVQGYSDGQENRKRDDYEKAILEAIRESKNREERKARVKRARSKSTPPGISISDPNVYWDGYEDATSGHGEWGESNEYLDGYEDGQMQRQHQERQERFTRELIFDD